MPPAANAPSTYVPLRVHGHHSLLAGVDGPRALLARAEGLGLEALALTDVDSLAGVVDFLQAAEGSPVRPILGAEITAPPAAPPAAPPGRSPGRSPEGRLIALVETETGWRNLCKLVSARHLGEDPGQAGAALEGPERFDRVGTAAALQEGLFFLVDHPELLLALHGRIESERLFAAISPAAPGLGDRSTAGVIFPRKRDTDGHSGRSLSAGGRGAGGIPGDREGSAAPRPGKTPPPQRPVHAAELLEAARAVGVAALAVPDVYYAFPGGAHHHRVRAAIGHNALLTDLPEEWLACAPAHLLAPIELNVLFEGVPDQAGPWALPAAPGRDHPLVRRTRALAERCRYVPPLGQVHFPEIELPPDETAYSRLCELAFDGARRRYRPLRPEVVRRLDYELTSIDGLGFAAYFLLVKRIADFARERGIPCVGRGSAADSLVSYCLDLTDADPLRYRLPFERFLNPARKDRPDIDLDFCWRRRDEIIEHVYEAFGPERTAMVSTLNCFGIRAAFRETALAEGIPPAEVNRWSKRLPWAAPGAPDPDAASQGPIERALRSTPECRDFPHDDERWQRVLRAADALLDTPRHFGLHPGGVVVSPGPITDFTACHASAKGPIATQFDKDAIEAIGLVKMDLLGNRALTTLDDCLTELASRGIEPELAELPEDDPETAELLRGGRTLGCFQVESPGMRNLLQQTGAHTMDDVIQAVALIRPGPAGAGMKDAYVRRFRGLEPPTAPHPRLTELLWDTHGIMLYQEDVMQAATLLAGMDLAEADLLRRTLQKQHGRELGPLRQRFVEGAAANGVEAEAALRVWELIANFVSFAFCKAHAVTYGRIAYRAVWLKAHYPAVYMAAFLASETGYYRPRVYVEEARRLGVPILPPDVNRSRDTFAVEWVERGPRPGSPSSAEEPCLRIGLRQVKGLSERLRHRLLEERERGPFLSLTDLLERAAPQVDEAANLIRCGALDAFDRTRPELLWRLHLLAEPERRAPRGLRLDPAQLDACRATPQSRTRDVIGEARSRAAGWRGRGLGIGNAELGPGETASLFPAPEAPALVLPGLPDFDGHTRGLLEFELLGLTVHEHPTALFPCPADERIALLGKRAVRPAPVNPVTCREVAGLARGRVTVRGWLAASRRVRTANGEWMRFLTLEDESGLAEVVVFPDVYGRDGHHLAERGVQCVTGVVEDHMGACTIHAERIW